MGSISSHPSSRPRRLTTAKAKALVDSWADQTPEQAHSFLSKPDVTVTNENDKKGQLPKIKALDATVKGAARRLENSVATADEAVAHAGLGRSTSARYRVALSRRSCSGRRSRPTSRGKTCQSWLRGPLGF